VLVPRPVTAPLGGAALRDGPLIAWCHRVIDSALDLPRVPA
jgi:hypothetical protein